MQHPLPLSTIFERMSPLRQLSYGVTTGHPQQPERDPAPLLPQPSPTRSVHRLKRGQTIEAIRTPAEKASHRSSPTGLLSDYMTARRLLVDVSQVSSNYGSAVRRCIDGEFPRQKLDL